MVLLKHLAGVTHCVLFLKYDQRDKAYRNASSSCLTELGNFLLVVRVKLLSPLARETAYDGAHCEL